VCNNRRNDTIDENRMKFCDVEMGFGTVTKVDKDHKCELKRKYVMFALRFLL